MSEIDRYFPTYSQDVFQFDPQTLLVDAKKFQFKSEGDDNGVTSQLLSIKEWEDAFSGIVYVWQNKKGELYIADGHQRRGLAVRLKTMPNGEPIRLRGNLFKEEDGWTAKKMCVFAAAKNIAEGGESTRAIDVAKLLRNGGPTEILDKYIPRTRKCYSDGKSLASLGSESFELVLNAIVPEAWGVTVAERTQDPAQQFAVLEFLKKAKPRQEQIPAVVDEAVAAGFKSDQQVDLLGVRDFKSSYITERSEIYLYVSSLFQERAKLLTKAAHNPETLTHIPGNTIDVAQTEQAAALYQAMLSMMPHARMTGNLSLKLTEAAREMADQRQTKETASRGFVCAVEIETRAHFKDRFSRLPFFGKPAATDEKTKTIVARLVAPTVAPAFSEQPLMMMLSQDTGRSGTQVALSF